MHLTAVNDAAKVAMAVLKNGGEATDAVEMAIRLLEDKEITNAGYGSNLTIEGQVECDATMIDHLGRSGAVGAISQVKNPIAVARLVLDESTKPLSLQRVPPNLLVGPGATDYAADKGVPILPPDFLVSSNARERWYRWKIDLEEARMKVAEDHAQDPTQGQAPPNPKDVPSTPSTSGFVNPSALDSGMEQRPTLSKLPALIRPLVASAADIPTLARVGDERDPRFPSPMNTSPLNTSPSFAPELHSSTVAGSADDSESTAEDHVPWLAPAPKRQRLDGSFDGPMEMGGEQDEPKDQLVVGTKESCVTRDDDDREDNITDTVGAIAVDCFGRIAAGSSSGGIGMKHKGRCGPAALVGIGTSVIPADPQDPSQTCVATVTSGTGEHMVTTTAAATAADRIYSSVRKENGKLTPCNEDEAMYSVIQRDFMTHPGVSNSHCAGAIGILAVKKSREGIHFYFGHNTDSFALASMHSEERRPVCTMSRSKGHGSIAQGGRSSRSKSGRLRG